jgi:hypothetical protein
MGPGVGREGASEIVRLRIGSVNVGTLRGRSGEVVDMAARRHLDFCCLQETRWRGANARTIGDYKIYWMGCEEGVSGVGVMVERGWTEKVLDVKRVSERLMVLRVIVGKSVLNLVSVYAPQVGRPMEEKEEYLALLGKTLAGIDAGERLLVCGDLNGHVGAEADGFEGVHGGLGFGNRNLEGEMILELADALNFVVANTWFKKVEESKLVTYESGGCRSVVDYILIRMSERKMLRDVKVIAGEACIPQHKLLVCVLELSECVRKKKVVFVERCKVWKLKKEPETRGAFMEKLHARVEVHRERSSDIEIVWKDLRDCLLEVADEVCGRTKGIPRHEETWWWNDEVAALTKEKRRLYRILDKSKKAGACKDVIEENKRSYNLAKCEAKRVVTRAQEIERQKFCEKLVEEDKKGNVFRVAKQIVRKNRDVVGEGCVKDTDGKIVVDDGKLLEVWRAYYDKISNEEFAWDSNSLSDVGAVCGPCERISVKEVTEAIAKMKSSKAAGPSGVVADMVKAAGGVGAEWMTDVCNAVVKNGKIPEDWSKSWMVNVYKGKGDALVCGSYRGIKLLEHAMKIMERVIEVRVRNIVKIDSMQFGFMAGKGTTDAIFIVRQLQEKYLAKKKALWMAFVDLEKAFDRVPRQVVWWALRKLGVDEWIISVIKAMYEDAVTAVKVNGRESTIFGVRVGVHQGSVLSPLLFIIVLEALSSEFREGLPVELLYADDLVLIAESEELLVRKIRKWKDGMEEKGLRVNMEKTKVMKCQVRSGQVENSGKWPCSVCRRGVGRNSICCTECLSWVHKVCSGIVGSLDKLDGFRCRRCVMGIPVQVQSTREIEIEPGVKLECVDKFCYLGDMLGAGGGVEEASRARVRSAWAKFRELAPILTARGASLRVKGKVYRACVQSVMIYGSETWATKVEDLQRLVRAERMMVRWMCGVTLRDKIASAELGRRLGIECVTDVLRRGRLRWFGHLERKEVDDWVSSCRKFDVEGVIGRGRSGKTWGECVKGDMDFLRVRPEWARDRGLWRSSILGTRPTRASMEKGTLNRK